MLVVPYPYFSMKHILYTGFLLSLLFACHAKKDTPVQTLHVTWSIPVRYNDTLDKLPWKLLDAINDGNIKAYDSSLKELSRAEVESKITLDMRDAFLSKEECGIMLAHGDSSFMNFIETAYTLKELEALYAKDKSLDQHINLKYRPAFESRVFHLAFVEEVKLDTTVHQQMGSMRYIRLVIPKEYTKSGTEELLCQVKYEDFKKMDTPEQRILDNHTFKIDTWSSDLTVDDGKQTVKLSSLRDPATGVTKKTQVNGLVFQYFTDNILFVESMEKNVLMDQAGY